MDGLQVKGTRPSAPESTKCMTTTPNPTSESQIIGGGLILSP